MVGRGAGAEVEKEEDEETKKEEGQDQEERKIKEEEVAKEEEGKGEGKGEVEGAAAEEGEGAGMLLEIEIGDLVQSKNNEKDIFVVRSKTTDSDDIIVAAGPVEQKISEWTLLKKADDVDLVPEQVFNIFKILDLNDDSKIAKTELRQVLSSLDPNAWTEEKLDALDSIWEYWDANQDGYIGYREFLAWAFAPECEIAKGIALVWEHAEELYKPRGMEKHFLCTARADLLNRLGDTRLIELYKSGFDLPDWGELIDWGSPFSRIHISHLVKAAEFVFEFKDEKPTLNVGACLKALLDAKWTSFLCVCNRKVCIAYDPRFCDRATACIRHVNALTRAKSLLTADFIEEAKGLMEKREGIFKKFGKTRPGLKKWWESTDRMLLERRQRQLEAISRDPGGHRNLALAAKGAFLDSADAHGDLQRLIMIDELRIGPDLEIWCQQPGGEPIHMNPARGSAGWSGNSAITLNQNYWCGRPCPEIILNLGQRARLEKVGFMDREWDDNQMPRLFECYIKEAEEDDWVEYGRAGIPPGFSHGDPLWKRLRNTWINRTANPLIASFVKFCFPDANGRRILHLFALGEPIPAAAITVQVMETEGDAASFVCTNLAGEEVSFSLMRDQRLADLKNAVASGFNGKPLDFKLLNTEGELLAHPDHQVLNKVFSMSLTTQQEAAEAEKRMKEIAAEQASADLHRLRFAMHDAAEFSDLP